MAHRNQRGAVRRGRHAAVGRVRALPGAALLLALIAAAASAEPDGDRGALVGSGLPDIASWWSEGGRAGWQPDLWLGVSPPWVLAGHALGGWSIVEPERAPQGLPFPATGGVLTPLVWYDSVAVTSGEGAPWQGFGASLASARGLPERRRSPRASAVVDLRNGSFGFDENSLSIERGDSTRWLRAESLSGNRGAVQGLELAGRHLWGVGAGFRRGAHGLEGSYAQRGGASRLLGGDEQASGGESGHLGYRYRRGGLDAGLTVARGSDHHEGFGDLRPYSRRDAEEVTAAADGLYASARHEIGARVAWSGARVARAGDPAFERRASALWGAARYQRALGDGRVRFELGAGRHDAIGGLEIAPGAWYSIGAPSFVARVGVERVPFPVWADLAPWQAPFLQRTWAGVVELGAGGSGPAHARATLLAGRTRDRALVARFPLDDLWLREGVRADSVVYHFGLLSVSGGCRWRGLDLEGDGFVLTRDRSLMQPDVDPGYGARGSAGWRFSAFEGDLGVRLRAEVEGVGERENQSDVTDWCGFVDPIAPRVLPGYVTVGATAILTLADAALTVRVRNLEDQPHEETWFDCSTGTEALGPGREWRFALTLRLMN